MSIAHTSRRVAGALRAAAANLKAAAAAGTPVDPATLAERLEQRAAEMETAAAQDLGGRRPTAAGDDRLWRNR